MPTRPHIFELTPADLRALCLERGLPAYTGDQVLRWLYVRGTADPARMTDLAAAARSSLGEAVEFLSGTLLREQHATDGTHKMLLGWPRPASAPAGPDVALPVQDRPARGRETECVMIPSGTRRTACISSQAGCPVGCRFCASGLGGLEGNLRAGQIVEQVWRLGGRQGGAGAAAAQARISHVVFMGMGEPLANWNSVAQAIRILTAPWATGISARRITVSTVGLPEGIRRLARFDIPVNLALSLHAPDDALRRTLIPWAEYATIDELLDACRAYFEATGREITLEYLLLHEVNDRTRHALALSKLAKQLRANVNLIRYNEVAGLPYRRPVTEDVHRFQEILRSKGVNAHIRRSRGRDIAAACGQLRHESAAAAPT
ncbi:MAG: 23S rRNA (adenine(2503)-C(2))-methyltransferase RlmN [Phycisphaeraceae bacterium]|nr:23S rRNA (adenine(2503)-C(2))-methyltransferase RlmN [Phycisphaeraceae bacterium]